MSSKKKPSQADKEADKKLEESRMQTLSKLEPFLRYWVGIEAAVRQYNAKTSWTDYISPLTVRDWYTNIWAVADIIDSWREMPDMQAHKTWVDAMRAGKYEAARDWLKVKQRDTFGDAPPDTGSKMLIEFAMSPSPFMGSPDQVEVKVHVESPESPKHTQAAVKKKSKPIRPKSPHSAKATNGKPTAKRSSSKTKSGGDKKTESKSS